MAVVAKSNSSSEEERSLSSSSSSERTCNYYKVSSLNETILGAKETSNLKDRYVLGEELGWGQFGVIRACSDKLTGEVLACKSIAKDRLMTAEDVRSVKLEIEIMTRLSGHPNVVDLKEVYEEEDYVHLVMELCAGGELFHQIEKHGRFSEAEARVLFRHLMRVVLYCHENGVVHRDLKPENILLATKASSSPIKLADFGLATYIQPGKSLHGTVGSPFYIAPEVLAGGYNQAADVWSGGVILYILLSGMPPFWGKTKSRIFDAVRAADLRFPSDPWDSISTSAKSLIKGMLCTDPSQRLTAKEVLDHLWMDDNLPNLKELNVRQSPCCREYESGGDSFSTPFPRRDQDISFGTGTNITCGTQSPTFSCRSSFSPFLIEPSAPRFGTAGFSFQCGSGNGLEFTSPISSMPSFAFFSPSSINEHEGMMLGLSSKVSLAGALSGEFSLEKDLPSSTHHIEEARVVEYKISVVKRSDGSSGGRTLGIHNKRNRTIGLGECEKLDFMVTESVIRWSSCTLIPTSLRSSLVC